MKKKIVRQLSAWLPVALWAALIFHFSSGNIPVASAVYWQDFAVKKTGHVLLFGVLALLFYRSFRINEINRKRAAILAIVLATFYGGTDEYHQMFTQGRESRVRDVFIDGFGASVVVFFLYYVPPQLSENLQVIFKKFDLK